MSILGKTRIKADVGGVSSYNDLADKPDLSGLHTQGTDTALGTLGTKNPPIDADKIVFRNSASSDALVTMTIAQFKTFLALLALGETSATAYRGDRGKTAYDYSQIGHLPLAGGTITGNFATTSVLIPNEVNEDYTGQTVIILDATSVEVSANIEDGSSYPGTILFVKCIDVTNGAALVGTIDGGAGYTFTSAMEGILLKQYNESWYIIGKYTP